MFVITTLSSTTATEVVGTTAATQRQKRLGREVTDPFPYFVRQARNNKTKAQ